jgi:two-component system nitrate/nitrite response regulator NarL
MHEILPLCDDGQWLFLVHKPSDIRTITDEIRHLKSLQPAAFVVLLADTVEHSELAASFAGGVDGYLLKEISPEALLESLNLVVLGEKVFPSQLALLLGGKNWARAQTKDVQLSHRELQIVEWLIDGCSNKIIATKLSITEATVKVHVKTILKKIGAQNRTQAAIWALQNGFSTTPNGFSTTPQRRVADLALSGKNKAVGVWTTERAF